MFAHIVVIDALCSPQALESAQAYQQKMDTYEFLQPEEGELAQVEALRQEAHEALLQARVLQLETVLMRTVIKSRQPAKRVAGLIAEFAQETKLSGLGRISTSLAQYLLGKGYAESDGSV